MSFTSSTSLVFHVALQYIITAVFQTWQGTDCINVIVSELHYEDSFLVIVIIDCINAQNSYAYSTASASCSVNHLHHVALYLCQLYIYGRTQKLYQQQVLLITFFFFSFFLLIPSGFVHTDFMVEQRDGRLMAYI